MANDYEAISDILSIVAMSSLLGVFVVGLIGEIVYHRRVKALIRSLGLRTSTRLLGFAPVMLGECIAVRRRLHKSEQTIPRILKTEIFLLSAVVFLFVVFLLAGFGSGSLLEKAGGV